jgi:DNA-directed RNA polymerase subunit RPC12/RpoP
MSDSELSGPPCPYCNARDTEMISLFGQQLMTAQYYCNTCNTPFERVKGHDVLSDASRFVNPRDPQPSES